ncbi:hypothetical protein [Streptomyces sp. NPDC059894]|uniref:hypothetical protein n=1 Tax=unclassified Streptomyces TaxID=2593676 RepID=UPI00364ACEDF
MSAPRVSQSPDHPDDSDVERFQREIDNLRQTMDAHDVPHSPQGRPHDTGRSHAVRRLHRSRIDAEALVEKVATEIRTWNERYRNRPVAFTMLPTDGEPTEQNPREFAIDTGFNHLVITWQ